jgi:hypothetical protein
MSVFHFLPKFKIRPENLGLANEMYIKTNWIPKIR